MQFGAETNVNRFSLEPNAPAPADVAMSGVDRITGDVLKRARSPLGNGALMPTGKEDFSASGDGLLVGLTGGP